MTGALVALNQRSERSTRTLAVHSWPTDQDVMPMGASTLLPTGV